jgi:DNA-directed RNA polymerase specialized sigma24 family protein
MNEFEMATAEVPFGLRKTEHSMSRDQERLDQVTKWFSPCRKTLRFTAGLILSGSEMAERAVLNCWIRASQNPPSFENEKAFRSWILRVLISESLSMLQQRHPGPLNEDIPDLLNKDTQTENRRH